MLHDEGGAGRPILLLHGLMGSARTWRRQLGWLRGLGHVYTFDAAGHGRPAPEPLCTEAFVADLAHATTAVDGPMVVYGHSMGGLHGWVFAATHPDRVRGLIVEDMAPDFRGRTADDWIATIEAWPRFRTADDVRRFFGPIAGEYFLDAFTRTADGYRLHGDLDTFRRIAEEWGTRHFWAEWAAVAVPALLVEGEHGVTPPGQMRRMAHRPGTTHLLVPGAGHLVHDERPQECRSAVRAYLASLG